MTPTNTLARDLKERYRCVDTTGFSTSLDEAVRDLERRVEDLLPRLGQARRQADERGQPVDFFRPVKPIERLHADFVRLLTQVEYTPARGIIEPMMRWYEDADGNFVEQFQSGGFDARIWELYLFAALRESGYTIDRSVPTPDFRASGLRGEFFVEATTVGPTIGADGQPVPAADRWAG